MQSPNTNVHSHKIRELAQAVTANVQVPLLPAQAEQVKAYLEMLADIHEDLSDFEFDSDSFDRLGEIFQQHGLDLFEMDSELDEEGLQQKYRGDPGEAKMPNQHPNWPLAEWTSAVAKGETERSYWEWVKVQIEDYEG